MKETKHTPGPWVANVGSHMKDGERLIPMEVKNEDGTHGWFALSAHIVSSQGRILAEVKSYTLPQFEALGRFEANCQLIQHAPELLEALEALVDAYEKAAYPATLSPAYNQAKQAITKATKP